VETPKILTVSEVAKILRVQPSWVATLLRRGQLEGFKAHRRSNWRVPASALRQYLGEDASGAITPEL
jgi:excisionase family DNA binding protein